MYPLDFHQHAEEAAVASIAAHAQGKFWEYARKLYENQKALDHDALVKYAGEVGLDVDRFQKDLKNPDIVRHVRMNLEAGKRVGVRGTPTMFLNGHPFDKRTLEEMKPAVEAEIAAVEKLMGEGLSVEEARKRRVLAAEKGSVFYDYVVERKPIAVDTAPPKPQKAKAKAKPKPPEETVYPAKVWPDDPVEGPADALVTIVECTDFQ